LISRIWQDLFSNVPVSIFRLGRCEAVVALAGFAGSVESPQVGDHYRTAHPDHEQWGNHWRRLSRLLLVSDVALVIVDAFVIRSVIPNFQYVVFMYLFGSLFVIIFTLLPKRRASREAWAQSPPFRLFRQFASRLTMLPDVLRSPTPVTCFI